MQPTLIIWGELDRVFPLELAHRLKRWIWRASKITCSCILVFIYAVLFCPIRCEVEVIKENIFHILWNGNPLSHFNIQSCSWWPGDFEPLLNHMIGFKFEYWILFCRHIGENAELVIIKNAGHAINAEKPKELCKYLKSFLIDPLPPQNGKSSNGNKTDWKASEEN